MGRHDVWGCDWREVDPATWATCSALVHDPPFDAPIPATPHGPGGPRLGWRNVLAFANGRGSYLADVFLRFGAEPAWQFIWDCQTPHVTVNRPFLVHKVCLWFGDLDDFRWEGKRLAPVPGKRLDGSRLGDVYRAQIAKVVRDGGHPHSKPTGWLAPLLGCCAALDGDVFDPYLGSGSTLLAAEEVGLRCVGVERDPATLERTLERFRRSGLAVTPC